VNVSNAVRWQQSANVKHHYFDPNTRLSVHCTVFHCCATLIFSLTGTVTYSALSNIRLHEYTRSPAIICHCHYCSMS